LRATITAVRVSAKNLCDGGHAALDVFFRVFLCS